MYGRYGYLRITGLLRNEGWKVNSKRIQRLWRREGLKVPQRQPKRKRLWLNDGSCIRLTNLFFRRGVPEHIRSDNGSEFTAKAIRKWLKKVGVKTLYIELGSPWENGYIESFNGKLRDEVLNREVFDTLLEAKVLVERWRREYNHIRPHSALGYHPPVPEAILPADGSLDPLLFGSAPLHLTTTAG